VALRPLAALALASLLLPALPHPAHGGPEAATYLGLPDEPSPGFASPFLGHSGSRALPGLTGVGPVDGLLLDERTLDQEREMGLRWTYASVRWGLVEPLGPTDAHHDTPTGAWARIDAWVEACRARGLNLWLQPGWSDAADTPPAWAGVRVPLGYGDPQSWTDPRGGHHESGLAAMPGPPKAPADMAAAAVFVGKLAHRYRPGGELAQERGWTDGYGVRVWELPNEPDAYGLWWGEYDDYAEAAVRLRGAIKAEDPLAVVLGPAASAHADDEFLRMFLDARTQRASLEYLMNGAAYAGGPAVDAVSFHNYESLDGRRAEHTYLAHRAWWDLYADQPGGSYPRGRAFWHTEGGLDFLGPDLDNATRARWVPQFLARGFAAGIARLTLMDLHGDDAAKIHARRAARAFVELLPDPHGLRSLSADADAAQVFRHGDARWTYVAWATGAAGSVRLPVRTPSALVLDKYGEGGAAAAVGGEVAIDLPAGEGFNEPVYLVEIPP
jgi:hypothetical protein